MGFAIKECSVSREQDPAASLPDRAPPLGGHRPEETQPATRCTTKTAAASFVFGPLAEILNSFPLSASRSAREPESERTSAVKRCCSPSDAR